MSSIRLGKAAKDVNVGISTAVSFLEKKGHKVEANPNFKITDEAYALLVKEFSTDKLIKEQSERLSQQHRHKEVRETLSIEVEEPKLPKVEKVEKKPAPKVEKPKAEEIRVEVADDLKPRFKVIDKIDLNAPKKKAEPKNEVQKVAKVQEVQKVEEKSEPEVEAKIEEKVEQKPEIVVETKPEEKPAEIIVEEKQEEKVFSLAKPAFNSGIKVVGTVDLANLNQKTRPDKKSKDEKRKEREDKFKTGNKPQNGKVGVAAKPQDGKPAAEGEKKKRKRIHEGRVDINNPGAGGRFDKAKPAGTGGGNNNNKGKRPQRNEISEEDVQKQVKE
ncbi:MAG: translation initiation factor IF-2, partial [Prevotellaceae bacterium]|nr:translation initiation factor IF-2 [Prevotellaceae bacterium]